MKVVSLFSGAGGFDLGFKAAGYEIVWANELCPKASQTYIHNFGDHIVNDSIENVTKIPSADVVIGGPPCQGFSVAGKMDIEDSRNLLVWEFVRVIDMVKPRYFVFENVDHLYGSDRFLLIKNKLLNEFRKLGYELNTKVVNACDYLVPQNRRRLIILGSQDGAVKAFDQKYQKISAREAIRSLPKLGEEGNQHICNAKIVPCKNPIFRSTAYAGNIFNGAGRPINLDLPSNTIAASIGGNNTPIIEESLITDPKAESWITKYFEHLKAGGDIASQVPNTVRRISVHEAARLQSFPAEFTFVGSKSSMYKQIGNAVPPKLSEYIAMCIKRHSESDHQDIWADMVG